MKAFVRTLTLVALAQAQLPSHSLTPFSGRHVGVGAFGAKRATTNPSLKLSPSLEAGLLLRGGDVADAAVVLKDFSGAAAGYFGGIRIPATFLAGSSLAAIFSLKGVASDLFSDDEEAKGSKLEVRVAKFYHLVSMCAFLLSVVTITTATVANTAVLHGRFDPMAETAYLLMKREFELEFVSCRFSFLTSMLCFLGIVMSRILIEFDLLKEGAKRKDSAIVVVCSVMALATHLLGYINQNLWCFQSLTGLGIHMAKLILNRAFVERNPSQLASVSFVLIATGYVGKIMMRE